MKQVQKGSKEYRQLVALLGSEAEADALIARKQQESTALIEAGIAYKSHTSAPSLDDLRTRLKMQSQRIAHMVKDATEAAEAQAINALMELADRLQLSQNAVTDLVKRYSIVEVMSILETLSTQKAMKGYMIDPFFETRVTRIEARDVERMIQQKQADNDRDTFFS